MYKHQYSNLSRLIESPELSLALGALKMAYNLSEMDVTGPLPVEVKQSPNFREFHITYDQPIYLAPLESHGKIDLLLAPQEHIDLM